MNHSSIWRTTAIATLVAGTLDILWAVILTLWFGRDPGDMLRYVASGPFPAATAMGTAGAVLGLATHFALMAIMALVYVAAGARNHRILERPWVSGLVYGLITYVVMNLIVVPVRFDAPLPPSARSIATQLFAHIVLVGWPIALIAVRQLRSRS